MADAKLQIVIGALNRAQGDLAELKKQLGDLDATGKKSSKGLGETAGAISLLKAVAGSYVLKEGVRLIAHLGELGAKAERAEATFEKVSGGAAAAAVNLEALKTATRGTVSEVALMEGATSILALGLASTADDVALITRNVAALGSKFGGTMQIFQLMMSNKSLMRIDSFGLGVEEVTRRISELKAAGMDADKSFDTAVLEMMTQKYEELGGAMEDNLTDIERSKAAWEDLKNELGRNFAPVVADVATALTGAMRSAEAANEQARRGAEVFGKDYTIALQGAQKGSAAAGRELARMNSVLAATENAVETTVPTFDEYVESLGGMGAYAQELVRQQGYVAPAIYGSRDALVDYNRAMEQGAKSTNDYYIKSQKDMVEALAEVQTQYSDMVTAMDSGIGPAIEEYNQKQGDLNGTLAELQEELAELEETHNRAVTTTKKVTLTEAEATLATLQLAEAQAKLAAETDPLKQAQLAVKVETLTGKLGGAAQATTTYVDNSKKMEEVRAQIAETEAALAQLEAEHTRQTGQILMNFAQQMAAADGVITQEELDFVAALGAQYGLLDTAGAIALQSLKSNFDLVTQGGTDAALAVALLQTNIDLLHGKDVSVNVLYQLQDPPPGVGGGSASGSGGQAGSRNEMYAAGGVTGGGWARVGEQGPEMVSMPPGARVLSNPVTNNVTNNYNLSMHTRASTPSLRQDFALMRAMG